MPDSPNLNTRDFSKYDEMDDAQLQNILREDASKPEGEEHDIEMLLYIMENLAKRRKERNEERNTEEAFASFQADYCADCEMPLDFGSGSKKRGRKIRWLRRLSATAAVLALVFGCYLTANALESLPRKIVAYWTKDFFHFGYADTETHPNTTGFGVMDPRSTIVYSDLQDALHDQNIDISLVPSYIPDGFAVSSVMYYDYPEFDSFYALYKCGDKKLNIEISDYNPETFQMISQNQHYFEKYESNGIECYIYSDTDTLGAAWVKDGYECVISGQITLPEIKKMVDSVGKG